MSDVAPLLDTRAFDYLEDVVYILNAERRFIYVNPFALHTWKLQAHEVLGKLLEDGLPARPPQDVIDLYQRAILSQERQEFETFGHRHRGRVGIILYPHGGGVIAHVRRLRRDSPASDAAAHDALTGCLTRQSFMTARQNMVLPAVLALIDLNRLKAVNALRGHSGGDQYIRQVAQAILEQLPPEALMARWGGDEFVVLLPGDDTAALTRLLTEAGEQVPHSFPGVPTFGMGVTNWPAGTPYERAFALADERLQEQKARLNDAVPGDWEALAFVEFSRHLETLHDPNDIIQHAIDKLLHLLDFDLALCTTWEQDTQYITHFASKPADAKWKALLQRREPLSGLTREVRRTQQTVWSTDYASDPGARPALVKLGVKSAVLTPVRTQGQISAMISLMTLNRWQTITPHMRKILELTALRLEHALELRRVVHEVRSTLATGLLTLGLVLEARDLETHGHTGRTAQLATQIGLSLGLRSSELHHLQEGAYLHDVGKLVIPDAILHKPGSLTAEEWNVMQTHTTRGWELASRLPGLSEPVLKVIRHHHERWDGSGYPDRLMGEDIPLEARIFAVCDVYDALISTRPYKDAWDPLEAMQEIQRQAGRHFDPQVVEAFLTVFQQGA
ncbi:HD domain-containing protein (plasmid) [Deinococcus sp. KNUC1210]|uniref:HD domain-containing phosphohydrolase n=1 Tax=Deinococcus sp. KNUC1210 TaxID=2917691 RepID=UPI001EF0B182|nr:HD domain-containing phosphohydrolase [Deinococcus sp. KNUC1210]ULH13833.1 HD domain-containing protein [Deinococcus sp. KNUC1210]